MLKKEFKFVLQDILHYSHDGEANIVAKELLLRAPKTNLLSLASTLSSIVMGAMMKASSEWKKISEGNKTKQDEQGKKNNEELDGEGIYMIVSSAIDEEKMKVFTQVFRDLLLSDGICLIDGKEPLTDNLLNSFDARETLRLMGEYIANFLLPSTMDQLKKKN